jgi:arogenate/prephenate dehydratase
VNLKVNHCLLALPGVKREDVKRVMSHPQALSQCDGYLTRMGVIKEAVDDTAGAAKTIALQQLRCAHQHLRGARESADCTPLTALRGVRRASDCAAVASSRAGELYGLDLLDKSIQDDQDNFTCGVRCGAARPSRALTRRSMPGASLRFRASPCRPT